MAFTREIERRRADFVRKNYPYRMVFWSDYEFDALKNIMYRTKKGGNMKYYSKSTYNDIIIGADTETSRIKSNKIPCINFVCAWTISIRAMGFNWVTLWGTMPSEFIMCLDSLLARLQGDKTYMYFHNLAYDWVFLRKFLIKQYGEPKKQLNVKPHYPINIEFNNGLVIKDSLILAQVKLEKWAEDLGAEHKKAVGYWDYDRLRTQGETFTDMELEYIEHDTLALVECLDLLMQSLKCNISSLPYTATGILRAQVREIGDLNNAKKHYERQVLSYNQYVKCHKIFQGGLCHGNRYLLNQIINAIIKCKDFTSSYPFCLLAFAYPGEGFTELPGTVDPRYILETGNDYAYMFRLDLINVELKDSFYPMPYISAAKASREMLINPILDNGRVISADAVSIYCNEIDLAIIDHVYNYRMAKCEEVEFARKKYLPRWFTDLIFDLFKEKQALKGIPEKKVNYALSKSKINSAYGLCCQRNITADIVEDYITGEFTESLDDPEKSYNEYISKRGTILPYQWGTWCTSYARQNLYLLGECISRKEGEISPWVYSDTDSIYSFSWNEQLVKNYNKLCEDLLKKNGYGPVTVNGKEYCLGVATSSDEDIYTEFITQGAKRYAGRSAADNELHITVAGVPKPGAKCLNDNLDNFRPGFIFKGIQTGKLTHFYLFEDQIKEIQGNEVGDSIDLRPCDYQLDMGLVDWSKIETEEVVIQVYDEE